MNNVTFFSDARAFVDRTLPDLCRDEIRNNLILGLALRLKEDPHAYTEQDPLMAVVSDESSKNLAMAIMTPPFPMIIQSEPLHLEALETLADALLKNGRYLPGVNGVSEVSDSFAQIWERKTGQKVGLLMSLRAYELRKVADLEYPSGCMRIAEEKDAQKVAEMHNAMRQELVAQPGNAATVESALKTIRQQRTFFWVVDGEVVSITNAVRPQIGLARKSGHKKCPDWVDYKRSGAMKWDVTTRNIQKSSNWGRWSWSEGEKRAWVRLNVIWG